MLGDLSRVEKIYLRTGYTDMRKQLDGLVDIIQYSFQLDPYSNSLAENCIRPFVIGRKNWLFAGSPKGAAASAGIYTLVETAKANGLDAMKYIKYILADMPGSRFLENPEYLDDYLPWDPMVQERCR